MADVMDLAEIRKPICYTVRLAQYWNGRIEIFVEDVADDERSRQSIAHALRCAADACDAPNERASNPLALTDKQRAEVVRNIGLEVYKVRGHTPVQIDEYVNHPEKYPVTLKKLDDEGDAALTALLSWLQARGKAA